MEAARNDAAPTQGFNIADPVDDQKEDRVEKTVEVGLRLRKRQI